MAENEHPDHLMCPFCGKDDIKYGVIVCSGCQAEISYQRSWFIVFLIGIVAFALGLYSFIKYDFRLISVFLIFIGVILVLYSLLVLSKDHSPEFTRTMKHVK